MVPSLFSVLVGISLLFFIQDDGWTALMFTVVGGHVNVLKTLIENKADVNMLTKVHVLYNCVHTILYTISSVLPTLVGSG